MNGIYFVQKRHTYIRYFLQKLHTYVLSAPDLGGSQGAQAPHQKGPPTMFICLAICATCARHLILFIEESFFVGVINYRLGRRQYFTC